MPPNDLKSFGPFSPLGQYSRLSAAASRPSSWGSTGSNRWTDEEEDGGGTWKKRTRGEEEDEPWRRRRRSGQSTGEDEKVRRMDEELARLREAPVTTVSGVGKFALSIDMNIFRPEDIEVLMSEGRLVVNAEREVLLDERTSVVRRFRRTVAIPDDVGTDAVAVHMSSRGILTITALRHARRIFGGR
ncbi:hypothetical protein niasHS_013154 [Heterodera schachtii]|uniref:SHSP domain-containing protein n=1 Tax=Heterodera schachtii TaxID=97005 RepID=A0ABD2IH29_HETSC